MGASEYPSIFEHTSIFEFLIKIILNNLLFTASHQNNIKKNNNRMLKLSLNQIVILL